MKRQGFAKGSRLCKNSDYQAVYKTGKRLRGELYSIIFTPNGRPESRLGISVQGCRSAVRRNRIKRIIREFYRLNRSAVPQSIDLVFAIRPGFTLDTPQKIAESALPLLKKACAALERAS